MNSTPKKIVIIGPESTGKSTLAQNLADSFGEPWVPEYARNYLLELNRPYTYDDLLEIAKGQLKEEEFMENKAKRFLFCDTDLHVIDVWSQHRFGKTHSWITDKILERKYDFYLLTDIDVPWQFDPLREHPAPDMRKHFFNLYQQRIIQSGTPYLTISGNHAQRQQRAIVGIKKWYREE